MNTLKRKEKYLELAKFLCTVVGHKPNGKPIYRTLEEAAQEFGYDFYHTSRLKTALVDEVDGERKIKDASLPQPQ